MPLLSLFGSLLGSGITAFQNKQMADQYYANEAAKTQYNSIGNQLQQWKTAGLNPINFHGNFQPVTGTPPQPTNIGDTLSRGLSAAGSLWQQKQIAKLNNDVQLQRLELDKQELAIRQGDAKLRKEMHDWNTKFAKQAFDRGEYQLAMDILDYTYAFSTHDTRVNMLKDEAAVSSEYAKQYPTYLSALINNYVQRNMSLKHSRKIADQRLVFDWAKHYDDMSMGYYRLAQDDQHFGKSYGLKEQQFEDLGNYRKQYLDYLWTKREDALRLGRWHEVSRITKEINNVNQKFVTPSFSPKLFH